MYRKRSGLSQEELAYLLDAESASKVSRYERSSRIPGLKALIGYELIFGLTIEELFAGMYDNIQENVHDRAAQLLNTLTQEPKKNKTSRKIAFLKGIASNETARPHHGGTASHSLN